ncbi:hypothetical protein TWF281_010664 [Arthrobotrys megalospora]
MHITITALKLPPVSGIITRTSITTTRIKSRTLTTLSSHSDIPSFLRHATVTSLNPATTVFNGTLYEYTVLAALTRCLPGISLTRVGGRDDAGVDLLGTWELPTIPRRPLLSSNNNNNENKSENPQKEEREEEGEGGEGNDKPHTLPLTIQCKNVQQKSWKGPQYIRELEGALASRPLHALGILASVRDITPGMKKQMLASRRALGFVKVTPLEAVYGEKISIQRYGEGEEVGKGMTEFRLTGKGGLLQQFAWNEVANRYIGGFGIGARYVERNYAIKGVELGEFLSDTAIKKTRRKKSDEEEALEQEITLTWNGAPVSKP